MYFPWLALSPLIKERMQYSIVAYFEDGDRYIFHDLIQMGIRYVDLSVYLKIFFSNDFSTLVKVDGIIDAICW